MSREIILDTETTGLSPEDGDRVVEIGAVELINQLPTGKFYHQYINPQRDMPQEAFRIHGLSNEFLADKPVFADIAVEFLEFIGDSKLVIHNAPFDMKFLNSELTSTNNPVIPWGQVIDSLALARKKFPTGPNSLDALCKRFSVNNSKREKHGALLDSELLAEVYIELMGGRQTALSLVEIVDTQHSDENNTATTPKTAHARPSPLPSRLSAIEKAAHEEFIAKFDDNALWKRLLH